MLKHQPSQFRRRIDGFQREDVVNNFGSIKVQLRVCVNLKTATTQAVIYFFDKAIKPHFTYIFTDNIYFFKHDYQNTNQEPINGSL